MYEISLVDIKSNLSAAIWKIIWVLFPGFLPTNTKSDSFVGNDQIGFEISSNAKKKFTGLSESQSCFRHF